VRRFSVVAQHFIHEDHTSFKTPPGWEYGSVSPETKTPACCPQSLVNKPAFGVMDMYDLWFFFLEKDKISSTKKLNPLTDNTPYIPASMNAFDTLHFLNSRLAQKQQPHRILYLKRPIGL
jgi:hypothetical protein